ncbi:MAG: hypothetical protein AAGG48_27385 [Planctomycetota bacterium]
MRFGRLLNWVSPLLLTVQLMAVSVSIAAVLGIAGAWAGSILLSGRRASRVVAVLFAACMLFAVALPLVMHAGAWESTAGKFGWLMLTQTGARAEGTSRYGVFSGLVAAGWIHALFGTAIVTLTTWYGVQRTPAAIVQQSRLDHGPLSAWWRVRLPIAMPWVLLGLLITGLLAASEMTVADLYGFRTIADEFYLFYAATPTISSVLVTCAIPLAAAALILAVAVSAKRKTITSQFDQESPTHVDEDRYSKMATVLAGLLACVLMICIVAVPIFGLVIKLGHEVTVVGENVQASWSPQLAFSRMFSAPSEFAVEYQWTAMIGLLAGGLSLIFGALLAMVGRSKPRIEPWLDVLTVVAFVIPGPVVGLVVVRLFQLDVPGFDQLYQQTLVPLLLALSVRSIPVAYWILRAAYRGVPDSLLEASRLDTGFFRRFLVVDRRLLSRSWIAAWLAAGVVASGDLPVTLPVIPPGVSTVGTRLFGLLHSGARYQEAALSVWYVLAIVVISSYFFRQSIGRRYKLE